MRWWGILMLCFNVLCVGPVWACRICGARLITRSTQPFLFPLPLTVSVQRVAKTQQSVCIEVEKEVIGAYWSTGDAESEVKDPGDEEEEVETEVKDSAQSTLKEYMVSAIEWYRSTLSPIMPPNCRFVPSCSNYAISAIKQFGPWKGGLLTAWRLLRCNPLGPSGYDPPRWPPPGFVKG